MARHGSIGRETLIALFGELSDQTVVEIMATGASLEALEAAAMWLAGADDVMGEMERPLTPAAARVLEILIREEAAPEEERSAAQDKR
ncbi:MAG: hypothetical protein ACOY99_12330 [Pseudomonadota bacterium]